MPRLKLTAPQLRVLRYIARHERRDWESLPSAERRELNSREGGTIVGMRRLSMNVVERLASLGLVSWWYTLGTLRMTDSRRAWAVTTPKGRRLLATTRTVGGEL